jgi:superfamily II DNA/RNA helicase
MTANTFASLGVPAQLVSALAKRNITEPFPVQEMTIPDALAGRDVAGRAPTGSGKTIAFGLPLITRVEKASKRRPTSLILAPTRELAEQIKDELEPLARAANRYVFAVYGGVPYGRQRSALSRGVDVLVATPGRLEDLIEQGLIDLSEAAIVVVDEADRMADMGFLPAVRRILDKTSKDRQTLLFSATLDGDVAVLVRDYQTNPVRHEAGAVETEALDAEHHFWLVQHHDRVEHTAELIVKSGRSIVFTRTRHGADRLSKQLDKMGVTSVALHGGRSQSQRQRALKAFSAGRVQALIATDVAARGIHIDAVETVVHYDPPADHKDYLHRSGRTARAGATGTVVSLVTREQRKSVGRLQYELNIKAPIGDPDLGAIGKGTPYVPTPAKSRPESSRPTNHGRPEGETTRAKSGPSVYVGNLPWSATDSDIHALFARHGEVRRATVITDRRNGRSKGFGFVEMPNQDAQTAIDALQGFSMDGRDLKVRFAQPAGPKRN